MRRDPETRVGLESFVIARSAGFGAAEDPVAGASLGPLPQAASASNVTAIRTRYGWISVVVSAPGRALTGWDLNVVPLFEAETVTLSVTLNA